MIQHIENIRSRFLEAFGQHQSCLSGIEPRQTHLQMGPKFDYITAYLGHTNVIFNING